MERGTLSRCGEHMLTVINDAVLAVVAFAGSSSAPRVLLRSEPVGEDRA